MNASFSTIRSAVLTGFLVGSSATLLLTLAIQHLSSRKSHDDDESNNKSNKHSTQKALLPVSLREEQLSRHALYFGEAGMQNLAKARILVVGLGGVGSHTAHMLARSGVGFLRLVDFDQVSLSSLNRHAVATLADVGTPKATCLQRYLKKISPCEYLTLEAYCEMYTAESGPRLLLLPDGSSWDVVVDAIDDVPTKAVLIADCLARGIRVLSCMGAGGKSDFTRLHLSDLRTAAKDPLATKLRHALKKHYENNQEDDSYLDDMDRLAVLYSSEKTVVKLADFTQEQRDEGVHQFGAVDGMRIRILPVLGTTPAIFGQALAATALTVLGNKPFQPVTGERVGRNVRNKTFQHLKRREDLIAKQVLSQAGLDTIPNEMGSLMLDGSVWVGPLQIDQDDVEYLYEIWRNKCAVSGARLGTVLNLVRWDKRRPAACDNLVLMSAQAIKKFDQENGIQTIPETVRQRIEERLLACRC